MKPVIQVTQATYPESDGKPLGETDEHRDEMVRHIELLRDYFHGQQVYVSGNLLVYYEQGNPRQYVVPDAFVVKGIPPGKRRIYKIWVEGRAPNVVIECTSRKTRRKDLLDKPKLYARLGVQEYFIFDPDREYLDPPLQGYRRVDAEYEPLVPDEGGCLSSDELGLRLAAAAGQLQSPRATRRARCRAAGNKTLRKTQLTHATKPVMCWQSIGTFVRLLAIDRCGGGGCS